MFLRQTQRFSVIAVTATFSQCRWETKFLKSCMQGCGIGVVRSRKFLGGVGVGFLTSLGIGVGFFCSTPDVQLDHFCITLLCWEFLLKWYNFFWNNCWNRYFLLCTTISIDFNSQTLFPLCCRVGVGVGNFGKSGVGIGNFGKRGVEVGVGYFTSDSSTLLTWAFLLSHK